MTTTIMRDSIVGDDWIRNTMAANPIRALVDDKTGQPNGNFSTGPIRLGWVQVDKLPDPQPGAENPKYEIQGLFPPGTDFGPLYNEYYRQCGASFPEYYDAGTQQYHGLHSPFRDQAEKLKYGGFTPGCTFIKFSSQFKPALVDHNFAPLDPAKFYPGAWVIAIVNTYVYGKQPARPKKGVGFGLHMLMFIGDDTRFGGGAPDPKKLAASAGIKVSAPIVRPNMGQAPVGQPGAAPAPHVPQQHYVPQQGYVPSPQPAPAYAPAATPAYAPPAAPMGYTASTVSPSNPGFDPDDDPSLYP